MEKFYCPVESAEQAREILEELEERSLADVEAVIDFISEECESESFMFIIGNAGKYLTANYSRTTWNYAEYTKLTPREFIEKICEAMPKEGPMVPSRFYTTFKDKEHFQKTLKVLEESSNVKWKRSGKPTEYKIHDDFSAANFFLCFGEFDKMELTNRYSHGSGDFVPIQQFVSIISGLMPKEPPAPKHDWKTLHKDKRNNRESMAKVICMHADTIQDLKKKNTRLQKSVDWAREQVGDLAKQRDEQADTIANLEKALEDNAHKVAEYDRLLSGTVENPSYLEKLTVQLNIEKEHHKSMTRQRDDLQSKVHSLRQALEAAQGTYKHTVDSMQNELKEVYDECSEYRYRLDESRRHIGQLLQHFAKGGGE